MKNSTSTVVDRGLAAARDRATATEGARDDARESRLSRRRAIATATATASRRRALRERTRPNARVRDARARRRESSRDDDATRRRATPSRASRDRTTTTTTIARVDEGDSFHSIPFIRRLAAGGGSNAPTGNVALDAARVRAREEA